MPACLAVPAWQCLPCSAWQRLPGSACSACLPGTACLALPACLPALSCLRRPACLPQCACHARHRRSQINVHGFAEKLQRRSRFLNQTDICVGLRRFPFWHRRPGAADISTASRSPHKLYAKGARRCPCGATGLASGRPAVASWRHQGHPAGAPPSLPAPACGQARGRRRRDQTRAGPCAGKPASGRRCGNARSASGAFLQSGSRGANQRDRSAKVASSPRTD